MHNLLIWVSFQKSSELAKLSPSAAAGAHSITDRQISDLDFKRTDVNKLKEKVGRILWMLSPFLWRNSKK